MTEIEGIGLRKDVRPALGWRDPEVESSQGLVALPSGCQMYICEAFVLSASRGPRPLRQDSPTWFLGSICFVGTNCLVRSGDHRARRAASARCRCPARLASRGLLPRAIDVQGVLEGLTLDGKVCGRCSV